jgi:unspecific monooxygenase
VIILSKPEAIENVLINGARDGSLIRSPDGNRAWNSIAGAPILIGQNGAEWQWRRKIWNPEFSSSGLSKYFGVVGEACERVIDTIKTRDLASAVPVDELFVELTMRVICRLMLGIPVDNTNPTPEWPPLDISKTYRAMAVLGYHFLQVATKGKPAIDFPLTESERKYRAALRHVKEFIGPRVDLALQLRDKTIAPESIDPLFKNSMLVRIAVGEPRYRRETLIAEAIEMLIAGTDTTAHTLSFAVGELALNPEVCRKAREVVDGVQEKYGGLTIEAFKELNYIRAIVKETLRLYSVASGSTSLQAIKPTTIEGIPVPAGTTIFWSMLAAGRDPETYPNPEEFRPERWLEAEKGSVSPPMIDFGSGAHRCLGEPLAMLEATLMLARLLSEFEWELGNGRASLSLENLQQNLLIYPPDGMPLRFREREAIAVRV